MAPTSVQMVLLQGENADGATVDENDFPVTAADASPTVSASDRVVAAIVGTRDDASSAGLELSSVGVACADQLEAAALRDALAAHRIENVMLVSAFLAATALTQSVGGAMGYDSTAVLFVEPDTATLAVVDTSDGSVADVITEQLLSASGHIDGAELMEMVAGLNELATRPGGLFVVGCGVDVASIKRQLEGETSLTVSAPEEPETALARGAALASANALASPTAALAYAQDPGTGAVDVSALPEYLSIGDAGVDELAYSAVADDEASAPTVVVDGAPGDSESRRRPGLLVGSAVAAASFGAALALEIALTVGIHTTVGLLPAPLHNFLAPAEQVFAPVSGHVAATKAVAPNPLGPPAVAPAPASRVPAAPAPATPVPAASIPAAPPVPVPLVVPPVAPAPVPPVHLPDPPASPPVVQAPPRPSPPAAPPPIHVPPPYHQTPPEHGPGPNPGGRGGGPSGSPGGGGPVNGPGPVHGNPGAGAPQDGGPVSGPGPSRGTPGGAPPGGGGPVGGEPHLGGGSSGGARSSGGAESGGGESGGGSHGGGADSGGGTSSGGSSGGGSSGGGGSGGGGSSGGGSSGGAESGGGHR